MDERLKVLVAMQMRYKVPRAQGDILGQNWLAANPGQTWATLHELLKSSQVVVAEDQLVLAGGAGTPPAPASPTPITPPQTVPTSSNKPQRMYRGRPI